MRSFALLAALVLLQDKKPAQPQEPAPIDPKLQARIDVAVDRGVSWLLEQARNTNLNRIPNLVSGMDHAEFVLYALIYGGGDPDHEGYQKLLKTTTTAPLERTYRVALTAMALEAFDRSKYQARITECAQFLADTQCKNGQWAYGEAVAKSGGTASGGDGKPIKGDKNSTVGTTTTVKPRAVGPPNGDNSNTQYAALGLRACAKAGVNVDKKVLEAALHWWESSVRGEGGWGYASNGQIDGDRPYGSMTAGAVGSMVILNTLLKKDFKKNEQTLKGLDWMAKNLAFDKNPGQTEDYRWQYYWIYAIERAADLFGTETLGARSWYLEGAEYLLEKQLADGRWEGKEKLNVTDTAFAILFLRRATKLPPKVATRSQK